MSYIELEHFIIAAKAATYVGDGHQAMASRPGSHDLTYAEGIWLYRDSYFGGSNFLGQEVVWQRGVPVWAMNYYGFIVDPKLIDAARAGETIKAALSELYREGRFLGGFEWQGPHGIYRDYSDGSFEHFQGHETISVDGVDAYGLDYHGGLLVD